MLKYAENTWNVLKIRSTVKHQRRYTQSHPARPTPTCVQFASCTWACRPVLKMLPYKYYRTTFSRSCRKYWKLMKILKNTEKHWKILKNTEKHWNLLKWSNAWASRSLPEAVHPLTATTQSLTFSTLQHPDPVGPLVKYWKYWKYWKMLKITILMKFLALRPVLCGHSDR